MSEELLDLLRERVVAGLRRSSVRKCSQWATQYRVMGNPYPGLFSYKHHPWLKEMHDAESEVTVGQKAAQMGYTEWLLNTTFYAIDVLGESVLYILPSETDAGDFSASRFDPALELSPHLEHIFSDVKNVAHKRAGSASLFVRGSRSRSKLKSLPVGVIAFDEVEEMVQANLALAIERASGQVNKRFRYVSTPSVEGHGINALYDGTSQEIFYFKCPKCSKFVTLTFPECLVITAESPNDPKIRDSYLVCPQCKGTLQHQAKPDFLAQGEYVPTYTDRDARGFTINQLFSCTVDPYLIAQSWLRAQTNPSDEQEFYNSKMGVPHAVKGAKITDQDIDACIGGFTTAESATSRAPRTIGIDVGKWLHYCIYEWSFEAGGQGAEDISTYAHPKLVAFGRCLHFEDIDSLIKRFQIDYGVIDANPERRKALELCQRFAGCFKMCFYGNGVTGRNINVHSPEQHTITVDRTSWLDVSLGRFRAQTIRLPKDIDLEYRTHIKAQVRIYKKDQDGNPVGRYVTAESADDHYGHASTYAEIALPMFMGHSNQTISEM